jgi:hypothetical protein
MCTPQSCTRRPSCAPRTHARLWQTSCVTRKLHTAADLVSIAHLKNILEAHGIACYVRNQFLSGALGEIPAFECWPQLWIVHGGDLLRARALLSDFLEQPPAHMEQPWDCSRCGERVEGQFGQCWNCGQPHPTLE